MTPYLLLIHLLNLIAPAAAVALIMTAVSAWLPGFSRTRPMLPGFIKPFFLGFALNLVVLVGGLAIFRADGKLLTYAALVLVSAVYQFVLRRAWKV